MAAAKVTVKHGKTEYKALDVPDSFELFQALLLSLTNVPTDRQKLIVKGKAVKDDASFKALKNGDVLMLMGSADVLPAAPTKKIVFEEDLTDAQKATMTAVALAGLNNLGNTCYMNSTLQCLRAVVPLKEALHKYSVAGAGAGRNSTDASHTVTAALGRLFKEMDASNKPVTPFVFTGAFRQAFPQFAEKSPKTGGYMQQDADECLQQIVYALGTKLTASPEAKQNMLDYLFAGQLETRLKCTEPGAEAEPETVTTEVFRKLRCHIGVDTNFLHEGLARDMDETLERKSAALGRTAVYRKTSRIKTLPRYLVVQFVRFFWRQDTQLKAKILRKVTYPMELDLLQFCAPELKAALQQNRGVINDEKDAALGYGKKVTAAAATADKSKDGKAATATAATGGSGAAATTAASGSGPAPMEGVTSTATGAAASATASSSSSSSSATSAAAAASSASKPNGGFNTSFGLTTGGYEMFGVVTHKGRSADSGHYVGWVREKPASDTWITYDDDVVTTCKTDDILKLSGGGDWHMTYMCFYRRIDDLADRFDANGQYKAKPAAAAAATTPAAAATAAAPASK